MTKLKFSFLIIINVGMILIFNNGCSKKRNVKSSPRSKVKYYPRYIDKSSVLTGYKTTPRTLTVMDNFGYVRLWYKDIESYKKDIDKKAKLVFEKKSITHRRLLNFPIGGLLLVEVVRSSASAAFMDKFMVIIQIDGKTVYKKTLTDTAVQMKSDFYQRVYWNAEPVALNFPTFSGFNVFIVDLIHSKRYKYKITPLKNHKIIIKNVLNKIQNDPSYSPKKKIEKPHATTTI